MSEDEQNQEVEDAFVEEDYFKLFLASINIQLDKGKKSLVNFTSYDFKDIMTG